MTNGPRSLPWYRRVLLVVPLLAILLTVTVLVGSLLFFRATVGELTAAQTRQQLGLAVSHLADTAHSWDLPLLRANPPFAGYAERVSRRLDELRPLAGVEQIELLDIEFRVLASSPPLPLGSTDHLLLHLDAELVDRLRAGKTAISRGEGKRDATMMAAYAPLLDPQGGVEGYMVVRGSVVTERFSRDLLARLALTILSAAALLVVLLAGLFLRLSRPMSQLAEVAGNLPAGNLDRPIAIRGPGEFGILADALEGMRQRVETLETVLRNDVRKQRERADRMEILSDFYLANMPVGTTVISERGVLHLNEAGAEILGICGAGELPGTTFGRILAAALLKGLEVRGGELSLFLPDGKRRVINYSFSSLPQPGAEGGEAVGLAIFSDVTASREAEEVHHLTENLAAVGDLAAGMAHEIRNPLGAIRDLIEILEEECDSETEKREIMAQVKIEVEGINNLIESLLAASRPSAGEWVTVSLGALAAEVEQDYRNRRVEPSPAVTGTERKAPVSGDQELLKRVLINLVENARLASASGVTIAVEEDPGSAECRLRVTDDGPGIPEELLDRVFLPFISGRPGGTGLGLYLVHRIVTAHGGKIVLKNLRPGLEVVVTLPRKGE